MTATYQQLKNYIAHPSRYTIKVCDQHGEVLPGANVKVFLRKVLFAGFEIEIRHKYQVSPDYCPEGGQISGYSVRIAPAFETITNLRGLASITPP
jgi:hypothetical protein